MTNVLVTIECLKNLLYNYIIDFNYLWMNMFNSQFILQNIITEQPKAKLRKFDCVCDPQTDSEPKEETSVQQHQEIVNWCCLVLLHNYNIL